MTTASYGDRADLVRFWIEFDLAGHEPAPPSPGTISLDGGDRIYRNLHLGIGVTGYDRDDCLVLIRTAFGLEVLPPIKRLVADVDVEALSLGAAVGVPVWRGIWYPRLNVSGPTVGTP